MYFRCLAQTPASREKFNINLSQFVNTEEDSESDSEDEDEDDIKKKQRI